MLFATLAGFAVGSFIGYRVGIYHGLRRLGSAELRNRLASIRASRRNRD